MKLTTILSTLVVALSTTVEALPFFNKPVDPQLRVQIPGFANLTGKYSTPYVIDGVKVRSFLGIPYVKAPVGQLRYSPPQEIDGNLGELDATENPPDCPQIKAFPTQPLLDGISEDCLKMNIWTPPDANPDSKLPVMVWINPGSFDGQGLGVPFFNGNNFIRETLEAGGQKVVLVNFNYRLGAVGFLASEELNQFDAVNLGLQDQRAAFLWVRKYISRFGGDPDNVTAFGESAGAISIAAHLVADQSWGLKTPLTKPLFDRAILQSGAAIANTLQFRQPEFDDLIVRAGCANLPTPQAKVDCLRQIPSERLLELGRTISYSLTVDGKYIPDRPSALLQQGRFVKIPILMGTTTDEGTFFSQAIRTPEAYNAVIQNITSFSSDIGAKVNAAYPLSAYPTPFDAASAVFGDRIFQCPTRDMIDIYASAGLPVYNYLFNKQPTLAKVVQPEQGVFHYADIPFTWNFWPILLTPSERGLARVMISYWTTFAANGVPSLRQTLLKDSPGLQVAGGWVPYVPAVGSLKNGGGTRIRFNEGKEGGIVTEVASERVETYITSVRQVTKMKLSILSTLLILTSSTQALPSFWDKKPDPQLRVQLPYGNLTGKFFTPYVLDGVKTRAFLGVPYVQAPVGPLRFSPPQEIKDNRGELDATEGSKECPQVRGITNPLLKGTSEDCLYMNIYTPANATPNSKLPVMVWVYGGSFNSGGTAVPFYDGNNLVRESMEDGGSQVVVVTFNYRIGALGFLASEELNQFDSVNLGLQDQRAAFLWVRKYIGRFGGDPDNVTAFGESAGAISIAAHLTAEQSYGLNTPLTKPLFDKAILQSGAAGGNSLARRQRFFDSLVASSNCADTSTAQSKIECLRQIPVDKLVELSDGFEHGVVVDSKYIPARPSVRLQNGQFQKVPIMIGTNADEGTFFNQDSQTVEQYNTFVSQFPSNLTERITSLYPLSAYPSPFLAVSDIGGDRGFQCPARTFADTYASAGVNVYNYFFNKQPTVGKLALPQLGVFHFAEVLYVWNFWPVLLTPSERGLGRILVSYWTSFAATGVPALRSDLVRKDPGLQVEGGWERYVPQIGVLANGGGKRLRFDEGKEGGIVKEVANDRVEKCQLWREWERIRP
ncbi:hypothetical protein HDV05_005296 [Chytridiales sp. JEL 0842]|nr:hypothetical protein HDV05_005296 [Chytridiales sp. JEL 0842]